MLERTLLNLLKKATKTEETPRTCDEVSVFGIGRSNHVPRMRMRNEFSHQSRLGRAPNPDPATAATRNKIGPSEGVLRCHRNAMFEKQQTRYDETELELAC